MKRIAFISGLVLLAATLSSCEQEENLSVQTSETESKVLPYQSARST